MEIVRGLSVRVERSANRLTIWFPRRSQILHFRSDAEMKQWLFDITAEILGEAKAQIVTRGRPVDYSLLAESEEGDEPRVTSK